VKLAQNNPNVVVHGRDPNRGSQLVDEIKRAGGQARTVTGSGGGT
jgi:ABC-type branched-subunit amino acid transport system substrate-binding protein